MEKKIAVLTDAAGAPTTLTLAESVTAYARKEKAWEKISNFSCMDFDRATSQDLRILSEAIADFLGEIKVILGSSITGAPYSALHRVGFIICESDEISDAFLDELFEELEDEIDLKP